MNCGEDGNDRSEFDGSSIFLDDFLSLSRIPGQSSSPGVWVLGHPHDARVVSESAR